MDERLKVEVHQQTFIEEWRKRKETEKLPRKKHTLFRTILGQFKYDFAKMLFANEQRKAWSIQRNAGKITGGYWQLVDQEWTKLPLSEQAAYQAGLIIVVCSLRSERYASSCYCNVKHLSLRLSMSGAKHIPDTGAR